MKKAIVKKRKRGGASVPCPRCGKDTQVIITRRLVEGEAVKRIRECSRGHKFVTLECVEESLAA